MRGFCLMGEGMLARILAVSTVALLLYGCAQQPVAVAPAPAATPVLVDPQQCRSQAECTTKTSRTLLFVFDYAAAGGALVQRQGRELFTPADAPRSDWPAIYIRLAEPMAGRFDFHAECQVQSCRYSAVQLLQAYRDYLDGKPGGLPRP
jgi:hypothetical protein